MLPSSRSDQAHRVLSLSVTLLLAVSIFPSLTALSSRLTQAYPRWADYFGPLNPIKALWPILIFWVALRWRELPRITAIALLSAVAVGTIATLIAAVLCHFPSVLLREWAVIALGFLGAASFLALDSANQKLVTIFWAVVLYGSVTLDFLAPNAIDWLYQNLFDPLTRHYDKSELGRSALTGIFGRQSLAKFLAWFPWLLAAACPGSLKTRRTIWAIAALTVFSTAAILATSQRGPFVGAIAGIVAFALHQAIKLKNRRVAVGGIAALGLALASAWMIVPKDLFETRMRSLLGMQGRTSYSRTADYNFAFRQMMNRFSMHVIAESPLGNACIPSQDFHKFGIFPAHAHNLILHQYRERGWIWGTFHAALWLLAFTGAWRARSLQGSCLLAGITTVLVLGLVDHPWLVINQAIMLGILIAVGLSISKPPGQTGSPKSS